MQRPHEGGREGDVRVHSIRRAADRGADAADTAGRGRGGSEPVHAGQDAVQGGRLEYPSQHGKDGKPGEKATHSLARLLAEYAEARSFRMLADRHGIHRPEIRRAFRRAAERLEAGGREQQALAAWIRAMIDKANPFGEGESKRQAAKHGDVFVSDDRADRRLPRQGRGRAARKNPGPARQPVTDLQREWEDILESHGLPADRGDKVLDQATYLGNPRGYADEESEHSTFMDRPKRSSHGGSNRAAAPCPSASSRRRSLAALDPGGCALTYFVDLRTKHRRDKWIPELQAARFRGRHHTAETRRHIGEANRKTYWAKTPEERAKSYGQPRVQESASRDARARSTTPKCAPNGARSCAARSTTYRPKACGVRTWRGAGAPRGRCSCRCRSPSLLPAFPRTLVTIDRRAAPDKHLSSNRIRNGLGRTHLPKRAGHSNIQQTAE